MKKAYVTILRSIDYLPGVLVLNHSLRKVASAAELLILTAPGLPRGTLDLLTRLGLKTQPVAGEVLAGQSPASRRQLSNHYKLAVLGLTQYRKVIYLDADMLVCQNVDDLFGREKWSAVNAGGLLSGLYDWMDFDSGLIVMEPCRREFQALLRKARALKTTPGSDRSYFSLFHPEWYRTERLHVEPNYNVYAAYLDRYCELYQYQLFNPGGGMTNNVKIIHFGGMRKPWHATDAQGLGGRYRLAFEAWQAHFGEVLAGLPQPWNHPSALRPAVREAVPAQS